MASPRFKDHGWRGPRSAAPPTTHARETSAQPSGGWAVLVYALVTVVYSYPALLGRFLVNQRSDQFIGGFPVRDFAATWERAGHGVPLWNPYIFGGMPYVASMNGDMFYPTALLRLALGSDVGMTWGFIVHVFLAGCFTYLFLRRAMGLGFFASLLGGLAYMAGGNVAGLVSPGHDGKLFVATLLPLGLFFVHRGVRDGARWAWGALAITVALALLSPHPQLFQYFLLVTGAYALFVALTPAHQQGVISRMVAIQRLAFALASVGVGILAGAIQYLPLLEYTPWSPRAGGKGWEHAISYSMPPEELLNTYLPQFSGILQHYTGRNVIHFHSEYLGASVLMLATLAFGASRVVPRRAVWFWTGALVVALLWSLGGYTPFYHLVYALVPGTKFFRAPSTMLFVVAFCAAVLAAVGVERVLEGADVTRRAIAWTAGAVVILVLAASGALTAMAATFAYPQLVELVPENWGTMTLGAVRALLVVAGVGGILVAVHRDRLLLRRAGWVLVAVVAFDLWSVVRHYWQFSAPAGALYASDPVLDYLKRVPELGRVAPVATERLATGTRDPYFGGGDGRADGLMVHGIRSVVGYHGNELGRYDLLTGWDQDDFQWPRHLGNSNLRQLLNIRYLYTNTATSPISGAQLVAGPARNVAGNMTYLYRLPGDNPAAWVVPMGVRVTDSVARATLLDPRFDVRRVALLDTSTKLSAQAIPRQLPEPLAVAARVTAYSPGRISITLDRPSPTSALLVVSENYYPGWSASVDGRSAVTDRVDYVLTGVMLPPSARTVELTFTSRAYVAGRIITLLALLMSFLALIIGWRFSRTASPELLSSGAPG
jgi:hypothetical protein